MGSAKMHSLIHILRLLPLVVFAVSCTAPDTRVPIPRRTAYPRIEVYDSVYAPIPQSRRLNLELNASATTKVLRDSTGILWLDVEYPRYGAVLHLTLTEASGDGLAGVARNREDRFRRDTDGMKVVMTSVDNEYADVVIGRGQGPTITPLHLMATDGASFYLSGALELKAVPSSVDEVAPVVDAVYGDLIHLGRTLMRL